ncbi:hypothetical protein N7462_009981 [Penicillium macrosclerotiorum]|uniref:uncharacterized protein n=1 Tax=Penicillium macrosclerotiorum TaxID=303699 RepID=UPI0025496E91|nr:uncharacterized protein N7462_009981 [Penicillium macrosclerotiorum]KAJ5668911.1 hypothetical protein N7462_009981 [Penicillium macrosclerotiorum]
MATPTKTESSTATPTIVDVAVIGAGLSGLRAALNIQAEGLSCAIIEAVDRVGGKTLTVASKKSGPGVNDVGAAWINDTTQSEMYSLLRKYGLQSEIQRDTGLDIWEQPDGSILSPHGVLPLKEEEQLVLGQVFETFNKLLANIDLENPAAGTGAEELDRVCLREWCLREFQSEVISSLFNFISQSLLGIESKDISALGFLHFCKTATGLEAVISDSKHGGQYLRIRQGAQAIAQNMAAGLKSGSLHLSTPVIEIGQDAEIGVCTIRTSNGRVFKARKIILSIATPLYDKIKFKPALPLEKQRLARENKLGYYSKIIFVFDQPWWRNAGLSGEFKAVGEGPILFSVDTSIPEDDQWSISCFVVGGRGLEWSRLCEEERYSSAWAQIRSAFEGAKLESGHIQVPEPINVLEFEWSKQDFFHGGPCPAPPPGLLSSIDGSAVQRPFENIHFIGTETALEWKGYMEGAIRSGDRGAQEVIAALRKNSIS